MFKEVIVVEGRHDEAKLKSIYKNIDIITTNGSEISNETLNLINNANKKRGVILFLDPDYPGERIRKIISNYIGSCKHAYLLKRKAISKNRKKVGIEHAKDSDIIEALNNYFSADFDKKGNLTFNELVDLGLAGKKNSKKLRKIVCEAINIPICNSKTFLKTVNLFGITKAELLIYTESYGD